MNKKFIDCTIKDKIIDCTLVPDETFLVIKRAFELANDPNRGCKMHFGAVLPGDMKKLTRFFGYWDMSTFLAGMGCGICLFECLDLIVKRCIKLKEEKET